MFGNLILADEINRAPAKVQAALLEAMEERQITVAGNSHALPELFIVVATQNPIEQEGTYPLPEAQMDRFLMKVLLDYPSAENESQVLRLLRDEEQALGAKTAAVQGFALSQEVIFAARREVSAVHVSPAIDRYLIDLINATRHPADYDADLGALDRHRRQPSRRHRPGPLRPRRCLAAGPGLRLAGQRARRGASGAAPSPATEL